MSEFASLPRSEYMDLPINRHEAHVLLRLLATANDAERTLPGDRQVGSWLADRVLRVMQEHAEYQAGVEALRKSATP